MDEPIPPCPCGAAVQQATITRGRSGPDKPIEMGAVRLEPCGHELNAPGERFTAWNLAYLEYRARRDLEDDHG